MHPDVLEKALTHPDLGQFHIWYEPRRFSLSKNLGNRPLDIASQIRLATKFVTAAHEMELISETRALLVVGGGPAGVAAALRAKALNVPFCIRDYGDRPFSLFRRCSTRWLHPYQYEWPEPWYEESTFPRSGEDPSIAMHWRADTASGIVEQWDEIFNLGGLKDFHYKSAPPIDITKPFIPQLNYRAENVEYEFSIYLFCWGFPQEDTTLGTYTGYRFWQTDKINDFENHIDNPKKVLISGAGDGGIQDTLRFSFQDFKPVELIKFLESILIELIPAKWLALKTSILSKKGSQGYAVRLEGEDKTCSDFVNDLSEDCLQKIYALLKPKLKFDFDSDRLTLISQDECLGSTFPLNHFLFHLLEKIVSSQTRHPVILTKNREVKKIDGTRSHVCSNVAEDCFGAPHLVTTSNETIESNCVVLRHGIKKDSRELAFTFGASSDSEPTLDT